MSIETRLLQVLQQLPPSRIAQVMDFVDFLIEREERQAATRRLGSSVVEQRTDPMSQPRPKS